ncbi:flap endonuclease GEN homolog 1-like [Patiria miniata]|uniref:Flap endonuclease GEN homolog 1 n=1 Tax=Patiria miniata TaxID=46514 RepID=A0A913ZQ51_PATMI|nr:flap endonuclease GEN homolog 1-like [Patiria miniata]
MGVNQLWGILAPIKTHKTLKSLKGQTIVVDLSVWICESSSALQGVPVTKPHLRNLFFRVTNLTQLGVNLIFVLDGEPPELKWDEMERRTNARIEGGARGRWGHWRSKRSKTATGGTAVNRSVAGGKKKKERKRFKFVVKECQEMLESLGVPCVQAVGEAEAMCALMNVQGLADACLTEDGDVFLYGARTVYKNFTLNTKDPHIECYSMDDIESRLGLDQSKLVALGLLLGCDYTLGVVGVGPKQAVGLMRELGPEVNALERFRDWADGKVPRNCLQEAPKKSPHCARCTHVGSGREHKVYGCAMCHSDVACHPKSVDTPECSCAWHALARSRAKASMEPQVMKKACALPDFPSEPVIEEFLSVKDKCPKTKLSWKRPQLISAQKFVSSKLEWPEDYTVEKVFPLVTLWDLTAISSGQSFDPRLHLTPTAVIKKRVRQGVACVEVQWQTGIPHSELQYPTTIEREELFATAFPALMSTFEESKAAKTKQKRKKTVSSLSDAFQDMDLTSPDLTSSSTIVAEDRPPTSIAKGPSMRNINVKPLYRKPRRSREITTGNVSHSSIEDEGEDDEEDKDDEEDEEDEEEEDVDAEPLPLSERLRLKREDVETITLDESSFSSSFSSSVSPGNPEDANFSLGFELTKMLSQDDTLLQPKECGSHSETSDQELSEGREGGPTEQTELGGVINLCEPSLVQAAQECPPFAINFSLKFEVTNVLSEDESLLQRNETLGVEDARTEETTGDENPSEKSELPEISKDTESLLVRGECGERFLPSVEKDQTSLGSSLRLGVTSDIHGSGDTSNGEASDKNQDDDTEDISLDFKEKLRCFLQKFEDKNGPLGKDEKLGGSPEELKGSLLQDDEGESDGCDVELAHDDGLVLNHGGLESESPYTCLSTCDRGQFSSQTPAGTLCHTLAPLPIDVDTPIVDDESFLGTSNQSEPVRLRAGQNGQPITTPVSHLPRKFKDLSISQGACHQSVSSLSIGQSGTTSHREQISANHKPGRSLNNQLESILHEVENSPVSLLDRLRRKHGNQNGVLSAALTMKTGSTFGGKRGRDRKILMEIFDGDNEEDDVMP